MAITINGSGTITGLATGGLPDGCVDSDTLASPLASQGITMIDSWRLTTDTGNAPTSLTSNWERTDTVVPALKGTGLTESSGVFTFPQTGMYFIVCHFLADVGDDDGACNVDIRVSTNSTTTYDDTNFVRTTMTTQGNKGTAGVHQGLYGSYVLDVESVSTTRLAFRANSFAGNSELKGATDENQSYFQIIRLGDT